MRIGCGCTPTERKMHTVFSDSAAEWVEAAVKADIKRMWREAIDKEMKRLRPKVPPQVLPRCEKCRNDFYRRFYGWCECQSITKHCYC
jgi:hypothetical protein